MDVVEVARDCRMGIILRRLELSLWNEDALQYSVIMQLLRPTRIG